MTPVAILLHMLATGKMRMIDRREYELLLHWMSPQNVKRDSLKLRVDRHEDCDCMACRPWTS